MKKINYHELKKHFSSDEHDERCSEEEKQIIDELKPGSQSSRVLATEMDSFMNLQRFL